AADLVGVPKLVLSGRSLAPDHFGIFQPYMAPGYHALLKRRKILFLNNSEAGATDYARWLGLSRDQFQVVHNGFEFPQEWAHLRSEQRRALGIPEGAVLVGSMIVFREEKRPELFIEMASALQRAHPDAHYVIFGDGVLLPACREFVAAQGLSGKVHLPGLADDAWRALSAMDVFVLTSRLEGLPNVMIEAQAVGLPVVCCGAGGMLETFIDGETGFSVPAGTVEALASIVSRFIIDAGLRKRMGAAALRHARENFSIDRMVDHTVQAYVKAPICREDESAPDWRLVDSDAEIRVGGAIKDEGDCFIGKIPPSPDAKALCLWEDDHRLGPAESSREDIRAAGGGLYAVDTENVLFSSSDHSDVRFNGRVYRLRSADASADFDEIVLQPEEISREIGNCYIAHLGLGEGSARFGLWENTTRLGPGVCLHDEIRTRGMGCYSVWRPDLYFSTSDNSDPTTNGRTYLLRRGRKAAAPVAEGMTWAGAPLERALRYMLKDVVPRDDFVPGRVMHVIGSLGPGGAERQALYTLSRLRQLSFESVQLLSYFTAATGSYRHDFHRAAFAAAGVPVRTIRRQVGDDDPASMPVNLRRVRKALPHGFAPDVADLFWEFINARPEIVTSWLDGNNVRAGLAAALAGVPRIILSGRNVNPSHFHYLYEPLMEPIYKVLLELPHVILTNNSYAGRDDYAHWLQIPADRIPVIHNGCDYPTEPLDQSQSKVREAYSIPADAIVVGTVIRLADEKQPLLFIEMAHRALQMQPGLCFIIFGIGALRDEMLALIKRLAVSDSVKLMGITEDIWTSLAAMDVFVLTSSLEGLPNVLIEAQCAGIPVVSTNVGGAPEAFLDGKTGFGIDIATPEALADAVLRLTLDPKRRLEMSTAASAFARNEFGVPRMIARTMHLYNRGSRPKQ
ncbi:MAG: glycosyltransferase, partial [Acetobacteraceae bacterium]